METNEEPEMGRMRGEATLERKIGKKVFENAHLEKGPGAFKKGPVAAGFVRVVENAPQRGAPF